MLKCLNPKLGKGILSTELRENVYQFFKESSPNQDRVFSVINALVEGDR